MTDLEQRIIRESRHWPALVPGKNMSLTGLARELARQRGISAYETRLVEILKRLAKKRKIRLPKGIKIP